MGKQSNIVLISLTFCSFTEKWPKVGQLLSITLKKFMVFHKGFLGHKLLVFMKFHIILSHLWLKYFASQKYCSYLLDIYIDRKVLSIMTLCKMTFKRINFCILTTIEHYSIKCSFAEYHLCCVSYSYWYADCHFA